MTLKNDLTRRMFVAGGLVLAACRKKSGPTSDTAPKESQVPLPPASTTSTEMPTRMLGNTGVRVSRIAIGGAHLGKPDEEEALRIVRSAIDRGVTFMDNAWDYNGGKSEERMGKALRDGYRQRRSS